MALPIRQGATHKIAIGPAVAVGDGFTPVTNLAISSADEAEVILHDNGTVVDISGYTFAAITTADGWYHLTLQSGISGTVGHMTVVINDDSLVLPLSKDFVVLDTLAYDAIYKDAAIMDVNVASLNASVITSTSIANSAITAPKIGSSAVVKINPSMLQATTIATLASQTDFTLSAGAPDSIAYEDALIVVTDQSTDEQKAIGIIDIYTGGTKRVQLKADPGVFTMAVGDSVNIMAIPNVLKLVETVTANTDMRGTDSANTTTPPTVQEVVDGVLDEALSGHTDAGSTAKALADVETDATAILGDTNETQGKLPTNKFMGSSDGADDDGNIAAILVDTADMQPKLGTPASDVSADIAAVKVDTAATLVDTDTTIPALIAALNDLSAAQVNAEVDSAFTTQMADSVASDGSIATREQALRMTLLFLTEFAASGTTLTVNKEDGTTAVMTFTLDDASNPTSLTRAT